VVEVFRETASGMKANRSARAEVMKLAQARHIDAILVTELSRWGRSTQDLLDTLNRLSGWRVGGRDERHDVRGRYAAWADDGDDARRYSPV
jgi:predicted site-specific integrase-resolvase